MSADLFPTPTRLALLAGVQRGEVFGYPSYSDRHGDEFYQDGDGGGRKVTDRVEEMLREVPPWVEKGRPHGQGPLSVYSVRLTEAGRKVLEANHG